MEIEEKRELCPITKEIVTINRSISPRKIWYITRLFGLLNFTTWAWEALVTCDEAYLKKLRSYLFHLDITEDTIIDTDLLKKIEQENLEYNFREKVKILIEYLYQHGGAEFVEHNFNSETHSPITYSEPREFDRIIDYILEKGYIKVSSKIPTKQAIFYNNLLLTDSGILEAEKGLPKMPLYGLVNQTISTGDTFVDKQIEHARALFFDENPSPDKMRSACETLSFVLEPLRKEVKDLFSGDTEYFFQLVNEFDIRHNKERTRSIELPEQYEWIFYSLLNTINTYSKIRLAVK